MRILVDTNILLDYILDREPYGEAARCVVKACKDGTIKGVLQHILYPICSLFLEKYMPRRKKNFIKKFVYFV